jgi:glycosyltransferase involved in cell wall biosynthesis
MERSDTKTGLSSRLKVLVISYTFPPSAEVGGQRLSRLCQHLPGNGVDPIVLTLDERFSSNRDFTLPMPEGVRIVRTRKVRHPLEMVAAWRKRNGENSMKQSTAPADKKNRWLRRHILALLKIPDRHWGWYWPALHKARLLLREEKIDAVLSSGPPWTGHMIARRIHLEFGIPWLADFRDPWASFVNHEEPAWWIRMAHRMEQNCIHDAKRVICNTDRLRNALANTYPREENTKFYTLTNGYERSRKQKLGPTVEGRKLFLHMGSIYGRRRIDGFCQAISQLVTARMLNPREFKVLFQGDISPSFIEQVGVLAPELLNNGCLEFNPRVDWEEAQRTLWQADLLLLFQGDHHLQVPAKVYEYLPTGIPIFAVTEEGALTDLLQTVENSIWAHPDKPEEIAGRFMHALRLPASDPETMKVRLDKRFLYSALGKRLAGLIREVTGRSSGTDDEPLHDLAQGSYT